LGAHPPPRIPGALAYYLRGDHIDAATGLRLGLVQEVVEHGRLLSTADEWCSRIAELPPHAVAMAKPLLRTTADANWNDALTLEEFAEPACFATAAFSDRFGRCSRKQTADSPVRYNAFDRQLQIWVAACLFVGLEDTY
jgi:enoyl-CoA hydratase/carnithine racemase